MYTLSHIHKAFGRRVVLKDISVSLPQGSLALLTGANGSGKSTLMKVFAGLLPPNAGTITGIDDSTRIAYVAHATFLYPNLTALENLQFWNACYGLSLSEDALLDGLARVGLEDFCDMQAKHFSRGMCQRLNLARALLQKPDLLLLDEPQTGLDFASRQHLQEELRSLRSQGASILMISHNDQDRCLADTVWHLGGGSIREEGMACGL